MLARLFRKPAPAEAPRLPDGLRVYAVGDVHGRDDLLEELLARIAADEAARGGPAADLIFLGDYVDRGAGSRQVVERLMALGAARPGTRALMGNHEEVLLLAAAGDGRAADLFDRVGGRETLLSYGVAEDAYDRAGIDDLMELIATHVPPAHLEWMRGLEQMVRLGDYLFVHAGIRPGVPLEQQREADLRWIRHEFLEHADPHEALVIHGHSITEAVDERENRIGIDTGAYRTGTLTALGLEGADRWLVQTGAA